MASLLSLKQKRPAYCFGTLFCFNCLIFVLCYEAYRRSVHAASILQIISAYAVFAFLTSICIIIFDQNSMILSGDEKDQIAAKILALSSKKREVALLLARQHQTVPIMQD